MFGCLRRLGCLFVLLLIVILLNFGVDLIARRKRHTWSA